MKRIAYILKSILGAIFLLFVCVSYAEVSFEKKVILGAVSPSSSEYSFSYPFKNTGDRAVKILKITTTCGCTKAEADREVGKNHRRI